MKRAEKEVTALAITPYQYYEDVSDALKFLARAFGFKKCGEQMKGENGRVSHGAMQFGNDLIMMGCPGPNYKNPKRLRQNTQSLYVNVDDVDAHFPPASKAGAKIVEEVTDRFYGGRRYRVEDLEGHEWAFAKAIKTK